MAQFLPAGTPELNAGELLNMVDTLKSSLNEARAIAQLTKWAKEGFYVSLSINDGHEDELGKPSYCLFVGNNEGEFDVDMSNALHGSLEEAVEAVLACKWSTWEEQDSVPYITECCGINCPTPNTEGHAHEGIYPDLKHVPDHVLEAEYERRSNEIG